MVDDKRRPRGVKWNDAEWEAIKSAADSSAARSVSDYLLGLHEARHRSIRRRLVDIYTEMERVEAPGRHVLMNAILELDQYERRKPALVTLSALAYLNDMRATGDAMIIEFADGSVVGFNGDDFCIYQPTKDLPPHVNPSAPSRAWEVPEELRGPGASEDLQHLVLTMVRGEREDLRVDLPIKTEVPE